MSQPWVAAVRNKPRTRASLPRNDVYKGTVILREAPAIGRIIQTDKGGRPSN